MKVSSDLVCTPKKSKIVQMEVDVGDRVRITMRRQPFRKGYIGDWSEEIFEIALRLPTVPVTHELRDLAGEVFKGKFYDAETQKVLKSDDERFDVDRVLITKKNVTERFNILSLGKVTPASLITGQTNWCPNESILPHPTVQQFDGLVPRQHDGTIYDKTAERRRSGR